MIPLAEESTGRKRDSISSLDFLKKLSDPQVLVILLLWLQGFFPFKIGFLSVNFISPGDLLFSRLWSL